MTISVVHCENTTVMPGLEPRFTLAYLDPPFFTGRDFETADGELAYSDRWESLEAYLDALLSRAAMAHALLIDRGSIVIHVDPTVSHYVKVECDKLFGRDAFASEIIWRYRRWPARFANFQRMHDVLLRWVKTPGAATFNQLYEPLSQSTIETFKGITQRKAVVDGKRVLIREKTDGPTSADLSKGAALSDVWELPILAQGHNERTGYPTQKPEALLERLVLALTNEGDSVLDPYMGSGTTLAVCHRLNRHATGIDASEVAVRYARERLAPMLAQRGLFEATGGA